MIACHFEEAELSRGLSRTPYGAWPRRMTADYAAAYCGELRTADFIRRVGSEYPKPRLNDGERVMWLRDDLDKAIGAVPEYQEYGDAADELL